MTIYRKVAILVIRLMSLMWIVSTTNEALRNYTYRLLNAMDARYADTNYARLDLVRDFGPLLMLIVPITLWVLAGRLATWTVRPIEANTNNESDRNA